jgi:hypothetical protein
MGSLDMAPIQSQTRSACATADVPPARRAQTLRAVRGTVSKALTRMVRAPARESILVLPGKVTVYQLTCHFTLLHSVTLVGQEEGR